MALPATESFTGSAGTLADPPWHLYTDTAGGTAKWVAKDGSGRGTVNSSGGFDCVTVWDNDTFGNDHYSEVTSEYTGPGNQSEYIYLLVRASGKRSDNTSKSYFFWSDGGSDTALVVENGGSSTATVLDTSNSLTYTTGDVLKLEVVGSTIKAYKNGTAITWTTSGTDHVTNTTIASGGAPGLGGAGTVGTVLFDNWQGDNVAVTITGTGAPTLQTPQIAAAGGVGSTSSAAITLQTPKVSGSGTAAILVNGTASFDLATPHTAGVGAEVEQGTEATTLQGLAVAGSGTAGLGNLGSAAISLNTPALRALGGNPLRSIAPPGVLVGYALHSEWQTFTDTLEYSGTAAREFNSATAENAFKMVNLSPTTQGIYDFTLADQMMSFWQANTQQVTAAGPLLYGGAAEPTWVSGGTWTSSTLTSAMDSYIDTVVGRYAGEIYSWEVVNEPIHTANTFNSVIGSTYIDLAFRRARAKDPNALLIINEWGAEEVNSTSDSYYTLVSGLVSGGTPIDGVGFEFHIDDTGLNWTSVATNFQRFADLGLKIFITELDVRIPSTDGINPNNPADLTTQATVYGDVFSTALAQPNCRGITMWGFTDFSSWISGAFPGDGAALPFDANYNAKPAYGAIHAALSTVTTGASNFSLAPLQVSGAGTETDVGAAAFNIHGPSLGLTGSISSTLGTAALSLSVPQVSASGTLTVTGSSACALSRPVISGTGAESLLGSIPITLQRLTVLGQATNSATGSVAVSISPPLLSLSGSVVQLFVGDIAKVEIFGIRQATISLSSR